MSAEVPSRPVSHRPFWDWLLMCGLGGLVLAGTVWLLRTGHGSGHPVLEVAVAAGITAVTTGFGAFPFLFTRMPRRIWVGIGNALAAGLMLGASGSLLFEGWGIEGVSYAPARLGAGALTGLLAVLLAHGWMSRKEDLPDLESLEEGGSGLMKMVLVVGVMTVHSFAEGMGVGVSYGDGNGLGDFIAMSIAIHNIPEGLAISLVLVPHGTTVRRAALWSVFSSLPQPLVAVPSFLFVLWFRPLLPFGLGLAAGAMIWMVFHELLPEAGEHLRLRQAVALMVVGAAGMLAFQYGMG